MSCRRMAVRCLVLTTWAASAAWAQTGLERLDLATREGTSEAAITPVYSQLFLYALPDEFHALGGGVVRKGRYVQQSVPAKETAQRWTQMITLTADEALAFSTRTYPQKMVEDFGARMKKNCPDSFSTLPLPGVFVGSYDTVAAVFACGSGVGGQGEAVMQMVIKGGMDVYTLEWAVRGPSSRGPQALDETRWKDRLRRLAPVRVCTIVPNEPPPYASCLRRR